MPGFEASIKYQRRNCSSVGLNIVYLSISPQSGILRVEVALDINFTFENVKINKYCSGSQFYSWFLVLHQFWISVLQLDLSSTALKEIERTKRVEFIKINNKQEIN